MLADSAFVEVGHERGAVGFETSFNSLHSSICAVPNFITSNFSSVFYCFFSERKTGIEHVPEMSRSS